MGKGVPDFYAMILVPFSGKTTVSFHLDAWAAFLAQLVVSQLGRFAAEDIVR
jgi:hypothetical protein